MMKHIIAIYILPILLSKHIYLRPAANQIVQPLQDQNQVPLQAQSSQLITQPGLQAQPLVQPVSQQIVQHTPQQIQHHVTHQIVQHNAQTMQQIPQQIVQQIPQQIVQQAPQQMIQEIPQQIVQQAPQAVRHVPLIKQVNQPPRLAHRKVLQEPLIHVDPEYNDNMLIPKSQLPLHNPVENHVTHAVEYGDSVQYHTQLQRNAHGRMTRFRRTKFVNGLPKEQIHKYIGKKKLRKH